jgi:pheromone shutdown protein TraB
MTPLKIALVAVLTTLAVVCLLPAFVFGVGILATIGALIIHLAPYLAVGFAAAYVVQKVCK